MVGVSPTTSRVVAPAAENLAMIAAGRLEPVLALWGFDVTQVIRVLVFGSEEGILLTQ